MLAAYFDDSGTHDSSRVVVWGGFMATSEQWNAFDEAWRTKLKEPLPGKPTLKKFSLSKCQGLHGEFENYSRTESDLVQNEFRQIIIDHNLLGVAFAVDRAAYDRLMTKPAIDLFGDAETMCFSACFNDAIDKSVRIFPEEEQLSLHFDQGRMSPKLTALVDRAKNNYSGPPELVNISFDIVGKITPLQAADIIATENYWHAQGVIDGNPEPRAHFAHFLERVSTSGYILDAPQIIQTMKDHGLELPRPIFSGPSQ